MGYRFKHIYLAHAGNNREEGKRIQKELESRGHYVKNPFDHSFIAKFLCDRWDNEPENRDVELSIAITDLDKETIDKCDCLVAIVKEPSIGTIMEILYAAQTYKTVCILTELESPWLISHGMIMIEEELYEMVGGNKRK